MSCFNPYSVAYYYHIILPLSHCLMLIHLKLKTIIWGFDLVLSRWCDLGQCMWIWPMCCPDTVPFPYIFVIYILAIYILAIYISVIYIHAIYIPAIYIIVIYISASYITVIYIPVINYFLKPSSEDLTLCCPGGVTSVGVRGFDSHVVPTPCHSFGRHLRLWWLPLFGPTF